ncbi:hypothetical protein ASPFODRAFT_571799 [Aspergillus luchuensis CBS 106.47]|uniref:Uncharacterized protein n=1 Tax=Aspergillus luchuensis (strain CBS 106.47) TaxID=1137211 RepID=A0A1M3TL94_ASPLC|nr:hypothetical protein ASPFODRAFT_571799 [Aspergillus luchuensis CBS 106.47]
MGSNRKVRNGRGKGEEKEGKESAGAATYAASSNIVCSFLSSTTTMSKLRALSSTFIHLKTDIQLALRIQGISHEVAETVCNRITHAWAFSTRVKSPAPVRVLWSTRQGAVAVASMYQVHPSAFATRIPSVTSVVSGL